MQNVDLSDCISKHFPVNIPSQKSHTSHWNVHVLITTSSSPSKEFHIREFMLQPDPARREHSGNQWQPQVSPLMKPFPAPVDLFSRSFLVCWLWRTRGPDSHIHFPTSVLGRNDGEGMEAAQTTSRDLQSSG